MSKIVVLGSINMDLVGYTQRRPREGETFIGDSFLQNTGGKGANQAVAAARLGAKVSFLGAVGKDLMGDALLKEIEKEGIDCNGILKVNSSSGVAMIVVDSSGQNSILVIPGANTAFSFADLDRSVLDDASIAISQFETSLSTVTEFFKYAKSKSILTILNPSPIQKIPKELLECTDYLVVNETEFEFLNGQNIKSISDSKLKSAFDSIGAKNLILTMDKDGVYLYLKEKDICKYFQSYKLKVVDTTAAGDSFLGGFASCMLLGKDAIQCCEFAIKVSALTVLKKGAIDSLPFANDVKNFDFTRCV